MDLDPKHDPRVGDHLGDGQRGFTLVEVLVAMVVLGLLMAVVAASIGFASRVREAQNAQAAASMETVAVQDLLRGMLTEARPLSPQTAAEEGQAVGPGRFSFLGRLPMAFNIPRTLVITLECSNSRLLLRWSDELRKPEAPVNQGTVELVTGLAECSIRYWATAEPGQSPGWRDRWFDRTRLPTLAAVNLMFEAGDRRRWPVLVVAFAMAT